MMLQKESSAVAPLTLPNEEFFARVSELLSGGKSVIIPVKGSSMLPTIRGMRDKVELEPMREAPVPGDIVLFRYRGKWTLHRVSVRRFKLWSALGYLPRRLYLGLYHRLYGYK